MHTIDKCPRCGNDFMYHSLDHHLKRAVAFDTTTGDACSFETICQECYGEETNEENLKNDPFQQKIISGL